MNQNIVEGQTYMKYLNPVKLQPVAALPTSPPSIIA